MIVIRFTGGLGNQMFQYALGRHLSLIHRRPLRFDVSGYTGGKPDPKIGTRVFGLHGFDLKGEIATADELQPFLIYRTPGTRARLARLANRCSPLARKGYLEEPKNRYWQFYPELLSSPLADPVCLAGNWQSERYFAAIADTIRDDLRLRHPPDRINAAMLADIGSTNSVAVHVRHGDNVTFEKALGVLPISYYEQAARAMIERVPDPHYYVFSDDPDWAYRSLSLRGGPTVFVSHNGDDKNYEDLRLMAACKHHIIANSTFSWWGAWLGKKDQQIVYASTKYFMGANYGCYDFYPPQWQLLPVS